MSPEAQRIAIAKACGWTSLQTKGFITTVWRPPTWKQGHVAKPPDYLNDLNAMHEAEEHSLGGRRQPWLRCLARVIYNFPETQDINTLAETIDGELAYKLTHATAAQRAEAFLKTLNLWEDAKTCQNKQPN